MIFYQKIRYFIKVLFALNKKEVFVNKLDFFFQENTDSPTLPPVPEWGVDIKCGKATNFSYGPWADRQRELIYKFFFPPDYQNLQPTPLPKPGDMRQANIFRIR